MLFPGTRTLFIFAALTALLVSCQTEDPLENLANEPPFESHYLYDLRPGDKPPRLIAIETGDGAVLTELGKVHLTEFSRSEKQIFPDVRRHVYEHYAEVKKHVRGALRRMPDPILDVIMPDIRTGFEIDGLVTLGAIEVAPDGKRVLLMYETEWDVEHGLHIIVAGDRVAEIGLGVDVFLD